MDRSRTTVLKITFLSISIFLLNSFQINGKLIAVPRGTEQPKISVTRKFDAIV